MALKCCSGCCGSSFKRIKQLFEDNVKELKMLLWFAGPLIIMNLLDYAPYIITTIFCGHLGKIELDSIMLANAFAAVTGQSVGIGLAAACDTLISQIFGGKNLKLIGVVVQKAILILLLSCFPCWAIYINTKSILVLCGQDPKVASLAEWCVIANIPALPAIVFYQLQIRYLQNQGIIWPQIFTSLTGNILNITLNYVFLYVLKTGVVGSAVAMTVTYTAEMMILFLYIRLRKIHVETWSGWSIDCLKDWKSFLSLGIPSMLMICIDWWSYEIAIVLTGLISLVELGAQSILYQLMVVFCKISTSIGTAASIRVGNFLGAGETDQAKKSARLSYCIIGVTTLFNMSILLGLRTPIAHSFTNDKGILSLLIKATPYGVLYYIFLSASCVFTGVLRGIGKPEIGAVAFALGYLLITFPLGVPLMFVVKLGMIGFWIGISMCFVCIDIYVLIYFWRLNWQNVTDKAQERAGLTFIKQKTSSSPCDSSINTPDTLELKNYASLESTSTAETELQNETLSHGKDEQSIKKLIIRRVLEATAVISTLFIGLIVRFTVTHH
ncbi:multidrug and toxin extrusion protein 1-like [Discoglossus pictus]